ASLLLIAVAALLSGRRDQLGIVRWGRRLTREAFEAIRISRNRVPAPSAVLNAIESRLRGYGLGKVSPESHSLCGNTFQPQDGDSQGSGCPILYPACVCSMPCWL